MIQVNPRGKKTKWYGPRPSLHLGGLTQKSLMLGFSNIPFWTCHMKWTLKICGIPLRHCALNLIFLEPFPNTDSLSDGKEIISSITICAFPFSYSIVFECVQVESSKMDTDCH